MSIALPERDAHVLDAIVIGGGPAGLSSSRELQQRGIRHQLLERGPVAATVWANLYDSLTLHTGKHMSHLPGKRFSADTPLWLPRATFVEYMQDYARHFALPLETGVNVSRIDRDGARWKVTTSAGVRHARAVVVATGIVSEPRPIRFPGQDSFRGEVLHSSSYRNAAPFIGRRVLVVGVGNSGGEIGAELARAGAIVTVALRSGANVIPRDLGGIPIQYVVYLMRSLPASVRLSIAQVVQKVSEKKRGPPVLPRATQPVLEAIPLIGFALPDAIRDGLVAVRPGVAAFTSDGVRFTDGREEAFDVVLLATGFQAAISGLLDGLVTRDAKGFARRSDRVASAEQPGMFFVGHNYDSAGGIANIRTDSALAASAMAEYLRRA
jgi:cation diffusion facilitator CzcD-associated flavoprotein CzcO